MRPGGPRRLPSRRTLRIVLPGCAVLGLVALASVETRSILYLAYIGLSLVLGIIGGTTLAWMLHAWWSPSSFASSRMPEGDVASAYSFSLIVPARHEEAVLERTLSRLACCSHPAYEVLVVVGEDDAGTEATARAVAERYPSLIRVIVDEHTPKSKPRALNAALPACAGTITGVFDAEDDVHPDLLRRVDQCFQKTDADVVQAGVQLMNFHSSWLTVRNVLEYYFWFRSRLHLHAKQGFIPLGGNTVFVRTDVLRAVDGWDPECLAEDCELGVRLSALGARTTVFYEPQLATREECPATLGSFVRQRTRWNQGYLQTLRKGYWRRLPRRERVLGAYILAMPYALALAWLLLPISLATAVLVKAPVPITLMSFLPVLPMVSVLVIEVAGLGEFCRVYKQRPRPRDYARLILGLPLYQAILAFAAARAVAREAIGSRGWEKTTHHGLHLVKAAASAPAPRSTPQRSPSPHGRERAVADVPRLANATALWMAGPSAVVATGSGPGAPALMAKALVPGADAWRGRAVPLWARLHHPAAVPVADAGLALNPSLDPRAALNSVLEVLRRAAQLAAARRNLILVLVLVTLAGVITGGNLLHWPIQQFDEGTYVGNAWALQHGRLAPYTYSYGHPPLGWLAIYLWTQVGGLFGQSGFSIDSGREFMLVVCLISSALLYVLARRLGMGRVAGAVAVVAFAFSPLALFFHRAVLLDNPSMAWALAAFVLARDPKRRLGVFAASGACFAASILSKETTVALLPALAYAAFQNADRRTARYCLTLFGAFFVVISLVYPLYAVLKGELFPGPGHVSLIGYTIVQLLTRKGTGSLFDPTSQTHAIVSGWLHLDPWLLGGALLLTPLALARRPTRPIAVAFLLQCLTILRPGYLPNMYVIGLLPFAALIVAGAGDATWRWWRAMGDRGTAWLICPYILVPVLLALSGAAATWIPGDRTALSARPDAAIRTAESWLVRHVGHRRRLIVTDDFWIFLIEHGFNASRMPGGFYSSTVISYWPLDFDPAVKRRFPDGWRDFDYVVLNQDMRVTMASTPTSAAAVAHSRVVASFGEGDQRIQVRAIYDRVPGTP